MPSFQVDALLKELETELREIISFAESLRDLPADEWTRKPNPKKWSVAECVSHLNIFGAHYIPLIRRGMEKKGKLTTPEKTFNSGYWGEKLTGTMKPLPDGSIPSPMGTLGKFDPSKKNRVNAETLELFIHQREEMLDLLLEALQYPLEKIRVTSTLGPIIRFKLGDTFRFMVAHDQRHILQMKRVLNSKQVK